MLSAGRPTSEVSLQRPRAVGNERSVGPEAESFVKGPGRRSMVLHREAHPAEHRSIEELAGDGDDELPADAGPARGGVDGHEVDEPFAVVVDLPGGVAGDATVAAVSHEPHAGAIELAMNATMSFSSSGFGDAALHRA